MWICLNDSFLSVVSHHRNKSLILVRARREADIENVFPGVKITETPKADYRFRTVVTRKEMKKAMGREIDRIDYDNFKNSVGDDERHDAYSAIWSTMWSWSRGGFARKPEPWKARRTDALTGLPLADDADDLATRFEAQEKQREKP